MNLLTVEKMTKVYTERAIFDKADFSINEGEKIGVIGINGTGKSTLLKIAAGIEDIDEGKISKGTNVTIRYLSQNPRFNDEDTVLQSVLKGNINSVNEWSVENDAKAMLNKLGINDYDAKTATLSGGQRKRIALASTLLATADILILDEPTNHLDSEMSEWLEDYLNKFKGALLMVTHDRYFLDRVTNRILEIDKGKIYGYIGGYSEYLKLKTLREDIQDASERKRQSILRTELAWISRGARARSTKQKARIERYEEMKEQEAPIRDDKIDINSVSTRMGKKTIELNEISKAYGDKKLIQDFSYIFLKNDRIGIIGSNGCGKSTLIKIINNVVEPDKGNIEIGQTIKIGYFSQENEYMDESMKVIDYVREGGEYVDTMDGKITASQMLERFLFSGSIQWNLIKKLSGGEKRRLYLLRVLMEAPNVLILDEPTNDLDIQTMTILEDYLDTFDGIVITVSHDRYFLDRIAKRIFAFEENETIKQYEGNYSDYLIKTEELKNSEKYSNKDKTKKQEDTVDIKNNGKPKNSKIKFTFKEQKEFETIDDDIASLEEKIKSLEQDILDNSSDFVKLNDFTKQKEECEAQLKYKMERWTYLYELAEKIEQQ